MSWGESELDDNKRRRKRSLRICCYSLWIWESDCVGFTDLLSGYEWQLAYSYSHLRVACFDVLMWIVHPSPQKSVSAVQIRMIRRLLFTSSEGAVSRPSSFTSLFNQRLSDTRSGRLTIQNTHTHTHTHTHGIGSSYFFALHVDSFYVQACVCVCVCVCVFAGSSACPLSGGESV